MLRRATLALLTWLFAAALAPTAEAQQEKLAQTGYKFLALPVDARSAALGDAMTAVDNYSTALFHNPAAMAHQDVYLHIGLANVQWITDITYNQASLSIRPWGGRFGVVGFSFKSVDYGDFQGTIRADNEQGFIDTGVFSPSALAFGVGYARALTDRFAVGGQVKYVYEDLTDNIDGFDESGDFVWNGNSHSEVAYDFGVLYRTGFESLNFAVSARNFAEEVVFEEESFQLPLTLKIGVAMDVLDLTAMDPAMHSLNVALEAENPRDFSEQLKVGAEYGFMDRLYLRAGYVFPTDEQGVSLGAGLRQGLGGLGFGADYAYTDMGVFNSFSRVHRLAFSLSF